MPQMTIGAEWTIMSAFFDEKTEILCKNLGQHWKN